MKKTKFLRVYMEYSQFLLYLVKNRPNVCIHFIVIFCVWWILLTQQYCVLFSHKYNVTSAFCIIWTFRFEILICFFWGTINFFFICEFSLATFKTCKSYFRWIVEIAVIQPNGSKFLSIFNLCIFLRLIFQVTIKISNTLQLHL